MEFIRVQSLITLFSHLFFIGLSYWASQSLRADHLFKKNAPQQLRVFYVLFAITIGYTVSNFFLDFMNYSQNLLTFFQ
ncbi:conserved hypothetical integral membrane protein [Atopostipes suicloacalis DSM 15692]|uniref:Conserved hypothetical integral membrane protein n=1 Tax=Atopostipes suicloacalis DSM 15692 TaxID=1121025 RepID=A0A1M4U7K2_9LACT|nr:conserved hypothetical integral membrane protein [Atopostipes suicloacalis DSM 15692]